MSERSTIYYTVLRERGENWDAALPMRRQEQWEEHAAFMDALADDGFVILGGPLGDGEEKFLLIVAADGEQAIEVRLADDPWTPRPTGCATREISGKVTWDRPSLHTPTAVDGWLACIDSCNDKAARAFGARVARVTREDWDTKERDALPP